MTTNAPLTAGTRGSRAEIARRFFGDAGRYLAGNYRIPLRAQIVAELVGNVCGQSVLDLGCGNGGVSAQFVRAGNRVTMVDFSAEMLERARDSVPVECRPQVRLVHADINQFASTEQYDLVLCIGVLAHVDSVPATIARVAELVKPGGRAVFQIGDNERGLMRLAGWVQARRAALSRTSMPWADTRLSEVVAAAEQHGLTLQRQQQHLLLLPGLGRLLGPWLIPYDTFTRRRAWLAAHATNVIFTCRRV